MSPPYRTHTPESKQLDKPEFEKPLSFYNSVFLSAGFYDILFANKENGVWVMITEILEKQRRFFQTGATLDIKFRIAMLKKLREAVDRYELQIGDEEIYEIYKKNQYGAYLEKIMDRKYIDKEVK